MTVKAVLFDLDGTLLDSIEGILSSFAHVLGRYVPHKSYTRRELIMKIGEPVPVQMLSFADGDEQMAARMIDDYRAHNTALLPSLDLYDGVLETLDALRARGLKVGIVTSKSRAGTMISIEAHRLSPRLDILMTADDTPQHKPHPMPLLTAAARLGLDPGAIVYVGDSVHDLRCAQGAGTLDAAALWGPFEREDLLALKPRYALEAVTEVLALDIVTNRPTSS